MSITDPNSVLILGAGVSAPFGLSLGGDLIGAIGSQIRSEINAEYSAVYLKSGRVGSSQFAHFPILTTFLALGIPYTAIFGEARDLADILSTSTHDTIDDFIVDYPSKSDVTKACVAALLFQQIYIKPEPNKRQFTSIGGRPFYPYGDFSLKNFTNRMVSKRHRNWIHHLINITRNASRNQEDMDKLKVITFNYDTVLEYVLEQQFNETEQDYGEYIENFDILHMHGSFARLTSEADPSEVVPKWAKSICVVQQGEIPRHVEHKRNIAKTWISEADRIYAVGFAFSGANCRLLGLGKNDKRKEVFYCNYDGNMGLYQSVKRIFGTDGRGPKGPSFHRVYPAEGTSSAPVSVEDWFVSGFAGETPA